MKIIEQQIKSFFGSKEAFCDKQGYDPKNFSKKLNTLKSKVDWINDFLKPLKLELTINERMEEKEN